MRPAIEDIDLQLTIMRLKLLSWFEASKRFFPWREKISPYRVWISEVMLQQTRASVVIPYFIRWMELFPTPQALAEASLEAVIKAWEGLGFYRRARNLHRGAKMIVEHFGGALPEEKESLLKIPGIGAYTASALLSFAFHQKALAVDGNVARVVTRYFGIQENISKISTMKKIAIQGEALLDEKEPWVSAEALIELGATLCLPTPFCEDCPLQASCEGKRLGIAAHLPIKNEAPPTIELRRVVAIVKCQGKVLVCKGLKGQLMEDLYEFPYFEKELFSLDLLREMFQCEVQRMHGLDRQTAFFTRYRAELFPFVFLASACNPFLNGEWRLEEDLQKLPFSSGHRKIFLAFKASQKEQIGMRSN